jgi:hypothetical protein
LRCETEQPGSIQRNTFFVFHITAHLPIPWPERNWFFLRKSIRNLRFLMERAARSRLPIIRG